ncbi:MAG: hypothetical protein OEY23_10670 [Acidimicrobiia bacterium]|nr:hypothetical protein [Acidimicrobiia bacterium]
MSPSSLRRVADGAAEQPPTSSPARSLLANSATVAAWTLVSRVSGLGRILAIGAVLGPTFFGNLFQTANQLPNIAFELIAGQLIASLLVPALVRHLDQGDRLASERVAGGFLGVVVAAFSATAVVLALGAPLVLRLVGLGVEDDAARAAQNALGWPLLVVVMPQLALYGLVGVANSVQNARGRYALAAAAPAVENVGVIATLVLYWITRGSGTDIEIASVGDVVFLGVGSTLSVVVHASLQWWGAHRAGVTLRPRAGWRDPEVRTVVRLAIPSLGLAVLTSYQQFVVIVVAASIAGGVVVSQLAISFLMAAVALSARPVAVASLPTLARLHADNRSSEFRSEYLGSMMLALFLLAPAAAVLAGAGRSVAQLIAFGEMSSPRGIELVAAILPALAIGVIGDGGVSVATQASYARLDTVSPLRATTLRAALLTIGMVIAHFGPTGTRLVATLGLSVTVANMAAFAWLHHATLAGARRAAQHELVVESRVVGGRDLPLSRSAAVDWQMPRRRRSWLQATGAWPRTIEILGSAAVAGLVGTLMADPLTHRLPTRLGAALDVCLILGVYVLLQVLLDAPEMKAAGKVYRRFRSRSSEATVPDQPAVSEATSLAAPLGYGTSMPVGAGVEPGAHEPVGARGGDRPHDRKGWVGEDGLAIATREADMAHEDEYRGVTLPSETRTRVQIPASAGAEVPADGDGDDVGGGSGGDHGRSVEAFEDGGAVEAVDPAASKRPARRRNQVWHQLIDAGVDQKAVIRAAGLTAGAALAGSTIGPIAVPIAVLSALAALALGWSDAGASPASRVTDVAVALGVGYLGYEAIAPVPAVAAACMAYCVLRLADVGELEAVACSWCAVLVGSAGALVAASRLSAEPLAATVPVTVVTWTALVLRRRDLLSQRRAAHVSAP